MAVQPCLAEEEPSGLRGADRLLEREGQVIVIEGGIAAKLIFRDRPELALIAVHILLAAIQIDLEAVMHLGIEMFEQGAPRVLHRGVDLLLHLGAQGLEALLDVLRRAAVLVDFRDALLEIDARTDRAEHLVGSAEDAFEKLEFLV